MARSKGSANFAGSLEVLAGAPLDARLVVNSKIDLTAATSYPYKYIGMIVSVKDEERAYMLIGNDPTDIDNWRIVGGDSLDVVVYRPAGSILFEDRPATLTKQLVGNVYYIKNDFTTTADFVEGAGNQYSAGTSIYVINMGDETTPQLHWDVLSASIDLSAYQEKEQYATLPTPSVDIVDKIYQYVGATTAYYTNGHFYRCIENPTNPGNYIYEEVETQKTTGFVEQLFSMPAVVAADLGRVVQYLGVTTADYTHGFFYEVIEDAAAPGSYVWTQRNTQPDQDTKIQVSVLPTATAAIQGDVVQYIGATTPTEISGYFYQCIEDPLTPGTYIWSQIDVQPDQDTKIQVSVMPAVTASDLGKIVQYIGTTTSDYTNGYFYECIEDPTTPGSYIWTNKKVQQGGGSGGGSLQTAITASINVGGIKIGDAYPVGTSYDNMWQDLLDPVQYPTFTNPSATISIPGDKVLETGATASKTITATFNRGTISPAYGTNGYRSGAAYEYTLNGGTAQAGNTFSVTVSESNKTFKVNVAYLAGEQPKDSKGNNYNTPLPAGNVNSNTITYEFVDAIWANTSNIATVAKLGLVSKSAKVKEFNFPAQTIANPEEFHVPASWTVTAVEVLNTLSNQWEDCSSEFTTGTTTHNNAAGVAVNYVTYRDNRGYAAAARKVRFKWS